MTSGIVISSIRPSISEHAVVFFFFFLEKHRCCIDSDGGLQCNPNHYLRLVVFYVSRRTESCMPTRSEPSQSQLESADGGLTCRRTSIVSPNISERRSMFKYRIMTQTQLGKVFGTTSHEIGKWLVEIGLRQADGKPSREAFDGAYCEAAPSRGQGYHWAWVAEKTVPALERAGHRRVVPPPLELVDPPSLAGPFTARARGDGQFEIVGSDGNVGVIVVGERNAKPVLSLLNLATGTES